ncbi:hypothetical protein ABG067_006517 [Albugo candida]
MKLYGLFGALLFTSYGCLAQQTYDFKPYTKQDDKTYLLKNILEDPIPCSLSGVCKTYLVSVNDFYACYDNVEEISYDSPTSTFQFIAYGSIYATKEEAGQCNGSTKHKPDRNMEQLTVLIQDSESNPRLISLEMATSL